MENWFPCGRARIFRFKTAVLMASGRVKFIFADTAAPWPFGWIGLIDQPIFTIAPIGSVRGLVARTGEERRHHWRIGVVLIHGRKSEQRLHGVNHVYCRVETVPTIRLSADPGEYLLMAKAIERCASTWSAPSWASSSRMKIAVSSQ